MSRRKFRVNAEAEVEIITLDEFELDDRGYPLCPVCGGDLSLKYGAPSGWDGFYCHECGEGYDIDPDDHPQGYAQRIGRGELDYP